MPNSIYKLDYYNCFALTIQLQAEYYKGKWNKNNNESWMESKPKWNKLAFLDNLETKKVTGKYPLNPSSSIQFWRPQQTTKSAEAKLCSVTLGKAVWEMEMEMERFQ